MSTANDEQRWRPSVDYVDGLDHVVSRLGTDMGKGIAHEQASTRFEDEGPNSFGKPARTAVWKLLLDQFKSSVVLLLIAAAAISAVLGEYLQTTGITVAIFINAGIGFLTEYQARVSLEKLSKITQSTVRVRRGGQEHSLSSTDLVRGDLVLLEPGDRVPADLRLVSNAAISVDESILTGESASVTKSAECTGAVEDSVLFQGTTVASGRGVALAVTTGRHTRLGQLSVTISELDTATTPLEEQLDKLGHKLTILTVILCVAFALIGIMRGMTPLVMLETSIALAVAAIPEGLPVVATLTLAFGIQQMIKRKALVRRLPAVEALGSASVICTDKTGTLTENQMLVTTLVGYNQRYRVDGTGYSPIGDFTNIDESSAPNRSYIQKLLLPAVLCNDANLEDHGEGWHVHGDPTEGALLVVAAKAELDKKTLNDTHKRVAELAFDLKRKRMSTLNQMPDGTMVLCCKGSPQSVLSVCNRMQIGHEAVELDENHKQWFEEENQELSGRGLRVLALATKSIDSVPACVEESGLESDLILLGLVAMLDPPKAGVKQAVSACAQAGIHVMMLTGDQDRTALAIARQLGILERKEQLISGDEVAALDDSELIERLNSATVFSRVTPELKLLIVKRLQQLGEVVAMTGDGVNDAPALKQADIGVAMGRGGSDLARDAASLVITDDNFATIVDAISQGRQIYNKIRSAIAYLLTASLASLMVTGVGVFLQQGVLLTPLQLLWLNLIMHVFPALGLVLQSNWEALMSQPPRRREEQILEWPVVAQITLRAFVVTCVALIAAEIDKAFFAGVDTRSVVLSTVSAGLLWQSWTWMNARPGSTLKNYRPMLISTAIGVTLILIALYLPGLSEVLQTKPIPSGELALIFAISALTAVPFLRRSRAS